MTIRCTNPDGKCEHPLPIGEDRPRFSIVYFPINPAGVALILDEDPSTVRCPNCNYKNPVSDGIAVRAPEMTSILFDREDMLRQALERAGGEAGFATIFDSQAAHLTTDRRLFKRAFLTACVVPVADQLNAWRYEAAQSGRNYSAVISKHCDEIEARHFSALWVLGSGAIRVGNEKPATMPPGDVFLPDADHLINTTSDVLAGIRASAGETAFFFALGALLKGIEKHDAIDHGAVRILRSIPSQFFLFDETKAGFCRTFESMRQAVEPMTTGAVSAQYLIEAAAALCYLAARSENPERLNFSENLAFFELSRTREGSDERQLLDPEILRHMVDRTHFIAQIRRLARHIYGKLAHLDEKIQFLQQVDQTLCRIYPDEQSSSLPYIAIQGNSREAFREIVPMVLQRACNDLEVSVSGIADMLMRTAKQTGDLTIVKVVADTAIEFARATEVEHRLAIVNAVIRALNEVKLFKEAEAVASETAQDMLPLLDAAETSTVPQGLTYFLCELGNCLRYAGNFEAALNFYQNALDIEGCDISTSNQRVLEGNIAIVLRSMGRTSEARVVFERLKAAAPLNALPSIVVSLVNCLFQEGRRDEAWDLLLSEQNSIEGRSVQEQGISAFAFLLGEAAFARQKYDLASRMYEMIAETPPSLVGGAFAVAAEMRLMDVRQKLGGTLAKEELSGVAARLDQALDSDQFPTGVRMSRHNLVELLVQLYETAGRSEAAEQVLTRYDGDDPHAWRLKVFQALHIAARPHAPEELEHAILNATFAVDGLVDTTDPEGDPLALLSNDDDLLAQFLELASWAFDKDEISPALLRAVADLQASPVSSRRIVIELSREASAVAEALDKPVAGLLASAGAALLQFVARNSAGDLGVIVTRVVTGAPISTLVPLPFGRAAAAKLAGRIAFHINRLPTTAQELALERVPGWTEFATAVASAVVGKIEQGSMLAVVPGMVDSTLVTLTLGEKHPIAVLPSLAGGILLDRRHNNTTRRPSRVAEFSVWRVGDRHEVIAAMENSARAMADRCSAQSPALPFESYIGRDATAEALFSALKGADLLRLSAHGIASASAGAFHLLVAAGGSLPPAAVETATGSQGESYRVSWNRLSASDEASRTVISTSCESGLVITAAGGERLGLERPLFRAGTSVFVAPQWEAPVAAVQDMTVEIASRMIETPDLPACRIAWEVQCAAHDRGVSPVASRCLGVFGALN